MMQRRVDVLFAAALVALGGCATDHDRRFPLAPHMQRDPDLASVSLPCKADPTKKDPNHVACTPATYVSPLAWDAIDNAIARPITETLRVPATTEATNATAKDEVVPSAWFTPRLGARPVTLEEATRGACEASQILDGSAAGAGEWLIDAGKANGSSPGFRVNIPGKGKYMFKSDDAQGEHPTAASAIGAAIYHAAGFYTSCEQVVYFNPRVLALTPGLVTQDNSGLPKPFDAAALEHVLSRATKRGELVRMQASAWLPGRLVGPFRYEGTRKDDPNDVVPHEDRRELRGGRLLAAWTEHHDAREQNSMDSWISDAGKASPDGSPGFVRHYYLDTSECFGSEWEWEAVSKRLGYSYLLDVPDITTDFLTFGIVTRPWDLAERAPGKEHFAFYDVERFVPEEWKNEYQNPAFSRMTERDGAWMARMLARVDPALVHAFVKAGNFTNPDDAVYLANILQGRLDKIMLRYLTRLSPLGEIKQDGDSVCAVDFARLRGLATADHFRYAATVAGEGAGEPSRVVSLSLQENGAICAKVPHKAGLADAFRDDAKERYVVVTIDNGVSKNPLNLHLYDLGERGFYLAGVERPDTH